MYALLDSANLYLFLGCNLTLAWESSQDLPSTVQTERLEDHLSSSGAVWSADSPVHGLALETDPVADGKAAHRPQRTLNGEDVNVDEFRRKEIVTKPPSVS